MYLCIVNAYIQNRYYVQFTYIELDISLKITTSAVYLFKIKKKNSSGVLVLAV